jgi:hypothetical protein
MVCKNFIYIGMPGYTICLLGSGIYIDIVLFSVPDKNTSMGGYYFQE